jgi:hypothetical protein
MNETSNPITSAMEENEASSSNIDALQAKNPEANERKKKYAA